MTKNSPESTPESNSAEMNEGENAPSGVGNTEESSRDLTNINQHALRNDEQTSKYLLAITQPIADMIARNNQSAIDSILRAIPRQYTTSLFSPGLDAVLKQLATWPSLSRAGDFAAEDEPAGSYSPELETPGTYFKSTERTVSSLADLNNAISKLIEKTPSLPLVWRGVGDADWGMYSSLYRRLLDDNGVKLPQDDPIGDQPYPDEDQMVAAEKEILRIARSDWRFDNLNALETFAQLQHVGGPTRLIDVTKNPYVAAWFAVEYNEKLEDRDGRLFAISTRPVPRADDDESPDGEIHMDDIGSSREPFWHHLVDNKARQAYDWGTGSLRRLWIPPAYSDRISAQNAGFIFDGVPMTTSKTARHFKIDGNKPWARADLLAASSIYLKMFKSTRKPTHNAANLAPTFSFRITSEAKAEIRTYMESRFGYRSSYIYPDIQGLAAHLKNHELTQ
ncbi:FRG domain-containing protein [Brachybacterium sp. AG952]|uniref:FRG domain-containing protein n=1 Tax=Brachybacterium sp. AG952 TaxID=2183989 RepID=UPI0010CFCBB5|nr:FRG domain-containing protein [Brachybacterium sp. AG952]TDP78063.1 FRG domain-containing protein [Brachybacterium sp. AG952]